MKKIFCLIFFALILIIYFSCSEKDKRPVIKLKKEKPVYIAIKFQDSLKAETFASKLDGYSFDTVFVKGLCENGNQKKEYRLLAGTFANIRSAGEKAMEMMSDSAIKDFELFRDSIIEKGNFQNFFFIGTHLDRPGLYRYNILKKKYSLVWSPWGKKIITFEQSEDKTNSFFITIFRSGNRGSFPYVTDARIYHFNKEEETINSVEYIGKCQRLQADWISRDTFRVILTYIDSVNTSFVYKKTIKYLSNGIRVFNDSLKFNLLTDGYPSFPKKGFKYSSEKKKYFMELKSDSSINIVEREESKKNEIVGIKGKIVNSLWNEEKGILILTTLEKTEKNIKSFIYGIDLEKYNIIFEDEIFGITNTRFYGNCLFYDYILIDRKIIKVFDIKNLNEYAEIKIKGNCGIKNIKL
ncbi:MAG: hypothetical protein GXX85_02845 [Ignavibacteria bacterium]|nr:hypothetical protein [Ignavibacteria bacterium]